MTKDEVRSMFVGIGIILVILGIGIVMGGYT